jgi:hypothetical protein
MLFLDSLSFVPGALPGSSGGSGEAEVDFALPAGHVSERDGRRSKAARLTSMG